MDRAELHKVLCLLQSGKSKTGGKVTAKERKAINTLCKQMLKLCDDMDEILDRMERGAGADKEEAPKGLPKVYINKEHYA